MTTETPRQLVARLIEQVERDAQAHLNDADRAEMFSHRETATTNRTLARVHHWFAVQLKDIQAAMVRAAAAPATPPVTFGTTTVQGDAPSAPGTAPYGSAACAAHGPFDSRCETCPHCLQESSLKRLAASQPATPPGETAARRDHQWPHDLEHDERPVLAITLDGDGDYIVRDLSRPGCICHADTIESAWTFYVEARQIYDAALSGAASQDQK